VTQLYCMYGEVQFGVCNIVHTPTKSAIKMVCLLLLCGKKQQSNLNQNPPVHENNGKKTQFQQRRIKISSYISPGTPKQGGRQTNSKQLVCPFLIFDETRTRSRIMHFTRLSIRNVQSQRSRRRWKMKSHWKTRRM
jgi:hypothetical protein